MLNCFKWPFTPTSIYTPYTILTKQRLNCHHFINVFKKKKKRFIPFSWITFTASSLLCLMRQALLINIWQVSAICLLTSSPLKLFQVGLGRCTFSGFSYLHIWSWRSTWGSRGLMDRALDLKPEVTQGCGFESRLWQEVSSTEVSALSKAPNPQLLPGRRNVGCPLLQVKCREHISLLIILSIIVYVTNKAHLSGLLLLFFFFEWPSGSSSPL